MTRRIYLAGPMTGYPDHNYPLFRRAADEMRNLGHYVYSPHETLPQADEGADRVGTVELRRAFADYARFICLEADTLVVLPSWEKSRGAKAEHALAVNCGLDIIEWEEDVFFLDELKLAPMCKPMPQDVTAQSYPLPLHKGAVMSAEEGDSSK